MKDNYFIIPCGGSGTRLWPLSRKNRPKQLLPFLNNKSLLEQTIDRIKPLAKSLQNIGVVTCQEQAHLITQTIGDKVGILLAEPTPRNTGPAILYSCLEIAKKSPEAVVSFLAADHFIPETKKFCSYLQKAINFAESHDKIVTLGLMPTYPATGYGYIQAKTSGKLRSSPFLLAGQPYDVKKFHEKPDRQKAMEYLKQGDIFWNLSMFVGKVSVFINEYKAHAPEIYQAVSSYVSTGLGYEQAPSVSIDYAIMEKSENITIIPCDFAWNDIGNLDVFLSIEQQHEGRMPQKATSHQVINISGKNNIAKTSKKVVTFIGVDNLCLIEDGDVILVAKRDEVEKVKEVHKKLYEKRLEELL